MDISKSYEFYERSNASQLPQAARMEMETDEELPYSVVLVLLSVKGVFELEIVEVLIRPLTGIKNLMASCFAFRYLNFVQHFMRDFR